MTCLSSAVVFLTIASVIIGRRVKRINDGEEPRLYQFKSVVSLLHNGHHYCGGTLIDDDTVLTAAECAVPKSQLEVRINAHNLSNPTPEEKRVRVTTSIIHPEYDTPSMYNYLILKLAERIPESRTVGYARMPHQDDDIALPKDMCHVLGWGTTVSGYPLPQDVLQMFTTWLTDMEKCTENYHVSGPSFVCAEAFPLSLSGPCTWDAGGPLFCYAREDGFKATLVGIVSSSGNFNCHRFTRPAYYARVSHVSDWISLYL